MPDWSRRRALQGVATAVAAAVAGCSGDDGFADETPAVPRGGRPVENYDARKVRDADGNALFWRDDEGPPTATDRAPRGYAYLTTSEDVADLTFADDTDAAAELRAFATDTDFETQSVSLHAYGIEECYDLRLLGVTHESDGYRTSFCQTLRPVDAECDADATDTVGFAIRLPFPGDDVTSRGQRWSRHCFERPRPVTPNGTEVSDDV